MKACGNKATKKAMPGVHIGIESKTSDSLQLFFPLQNGVAYMYEYHPMDHRNFA